MIEVCCELYNCVWNIDGLCSSDYVGINADGKAECFKERKR